MTNIYVLSKHLYTRNIDFDWANYEIFKISTFTLNHLHMNIERQNTKKKQLECVSWFYCDQQSIATTC